MFNKKDLTIIYIAILILALITFILIIISLNLDKISISQEKGGISQEKGGISCIEEWNCIDWTSCNNRTQNRQCIDLNGCNTNKTRPSEIQECSCTESWACNDWSNCVNNASIRTCKDLNYCGTELNKPPISGACKISTDFMQTNISLCPGSTISTCSNSISYLELFSYDLVTKKMTRIYNFPYTFNYNNDRLDFPIYWDDNNLVYSSKKNDTNQLFSYNFVQYKTNEILSQSSDRRYSPSASYGNVLFVSKKDSGKEFEFGNENYTLYHYDLGIYSLITNEKRAITSDTFFKFNQKIYKNVIVWTQVDNPYIFGQNQYIHYYDIKNNINKRLTISNNVSEIMPRIPFISDYGLLWVESSHIGGGYHANQTILSYSFEDESLRPISSKIGAPYYKEQYGPIARNKNYVSWSDINRTQEHLYIYNLNTRQQILLSNSSNVSKYLSFLEMSEEYLVWAEEYPDNVSKIIGYNFMSNQIKEIVTIEEKILGIEIYGDEIFFVSERDNNHILYKTSITDKTTDKIYSSEKVLILNDLAENKLLFMRLDTSLKVNEDSQDK